MRRSDFYSCTDAPLQPGFAIAAKHWSPATGLRLTVESVIPEHPGSCWLGVTAHKVNPVGYLILLLILFSTFKMSSFLFLFFPGLARGRQTDFTIFLQQPIFVFFRIPSFAMSWRVEWRAPAWSTSLKCTMNQTFSPGRNLNFSLDLFIHRKQECDFSKTLPSVVQTKLEITIHRELALSLVRYFCLFVAKSRLCKVFQLWIIFCKVSFHG